jgi:hypothetical protein
MARLFVRDRQVGEDVEDLVAQPATSGFAPGFDDYTVRQFVTAR